CRRASGLNPIGDSDGQQRQGGLRGDRDGDGGHQRPRQVSLVDYEAVGLSSQFSCLSDIFSFGEGGGRMRSEDDLDLTSYGNLLEKLLTQLQRLPGPLRAKVEAQGKEVLSLVRGRRPPRFVLIGRRGAGKSTLLNAIFGSKVADVGPVVAQTVPLRTLAPERNSRGASPVAA